MTARAPVLRVAAAGLAVALLSVLVAAGAVLLQERRDSGARLRATATAQGQVLKVVPARGLTGRGSAVRVRWLDLAGRRHSQRFAVGTGSAYPTGSAFAIAYDPTDSSARGLPADPHVGGPAARVRTAAFVPLVVTLAVLLRWMGRLVRFRRRTRRGGPLAAAVTTQSYGRLRLGSRVWLALAEPGRPDHVLAWQRVMWHPVLDGIDPVEPVRVVAARTSGGLQLADGTRLVPVGRPRPDRPVLGHLRDRGPERARLQAAFVLPAGVPPPPARLWWSTGAVLGLCGAGGGAATGLLVGGTGVWAPLAAAGAALLVNGWGLTGGPP